MIPALALRHWPKLLAGLAVLGLILAVAHYRHDAQSWRSVATAWRSAFNTQKAAYVSAQAAARAKAEAQRVREQARYDTLAQRADANDEQIADLRAAADRHARANSLRARIAAAQGAAGRAGSVGKGDATSGRDGSGEDSVILSRGDFEALNDNTVQLIRVNRWADELIAEGLAVKSAD